MTITTKCVKNYEIQTRYEAAQVLYKITFPSLTPVLGYKVPHIITNIITKLQAFNTN